ncbi:MAG: copper resistance protein CopC [Gordonia sp. (in: high G+C Gram-positive bacteria)]|uniref:copper resistance CopC family protein n=1 Tax=Gordonia sp. (in: high G+C Gram-positive bacteria) TaxID=84139 RepID=UPI0039E34F0E
MKSFRYGAAAVLTLLVAILGLSTAGPASAHSAVVGSSPEDGAKLDRSPGTVSIEFNEDLQPEYAILKVVGPDRHFWQQGDAVVTANTVSVPVNGLGPVGEYKINYRVTSKDGHPVQGQRVFELTVAGTGQPGPLADPEETKAPGSAGVNPWWFIAPALVVVAIAAAALALRLRRRDDA